MDASARQVRKGRREHALGQSEAVVTDAQFELDAAAKAKPDPERVEVLGGVMYKLFRGIAWTEIHITAMQNDGRLEEVSFFGHQSLSMAHSWLDAWLAYQRGWTGTATEGDVRRALEEDLERREQCHTV